MGLNSLLYQIWAYGGILSHSDSSQLSELGGRVLSLYTSTLFHNSRSKEKRWTWVRPLPLDNANASSGSCYCSIRPHSQEDEGFRFWLKDRVLPRDFRTPVTEHGEMEGGISLALLSKSTNWTPAWAAQLRSFCQHWLIRLVSAASTWLCEKEMNTGRPQAASLFSKNKPPSLLVGFTFKAPLT